MPAKRSRRMRCCVGSKLERVSVCAWTRASSGASCLRTCDGGGLVVDEDAAFAGGEDFAAENDVGGFRVDAVGFEDGFGAGRGLEDAGDDGLVCAVADDARRRTFAAHQEGQCIHEDGFARAGFAGEEIEAGAKGGDGVIDDGVVFSAEFDEHFFLFPWPWTRVCGISSRPNRRSPFDFDCPLWRTISAQGRLSTPFPFTPFRVRSLRMTGLESGTGIRAQHSMNRRAKGQRIEERRSERGIQRVTWARGTASDTVEVEVKDDFYRSDCFHFPD